MKPTLRRFIGREMARSEVGGLVCLGDDRWLVSNYMIVRISDKWFEPTYSDAAKESQARRDQVAWGGKLPDLEEFIAKSIAEHTHMLEPYRLGRFHIMVDMGGTPCHLYKRPDMRILPINIDYLKTVEKWSKQKIDYMTHNKIRDPIAVYGVTKELIGLIMPIYNEELCAVHRNVNAQELIEIMSDKSSYVPPTEPDYDADPYDGW